MQQPGQVGHLGLLLGRLALLGLPRLLGRGGVGGGHLAAQSRQPGQGGRLNRLVPFFAPIHNQRTSTEILW